MAREVIFAEQEAVRGYYTDTFAICTFDAPYFAIVPGTKYIVSWDGVEYPCTAFEATVNGATGYGIGNGSIYSVGENTGEPFLIVEIPPTEDGSADGSNGMFTSDLEATAHTVAIYQEVAAEPVPGVDILLRDRNGNQIAYPGLNYLDVPTVAGGIQSFATYDPETLKAENLPVGVNVGDVRGALEIPEQTAVTIDPDFSAGDMTVTPDAGKVFSGVKVNKPSTLTPENIVKDVTVAGVIGTADMSGGGGDLGEGDYLVTVIDYDGTVLLEKMAYEGDVITLPDPPEHERLVFDGWSASVEVVNNTVTVPKGDIMAGAIYYTKSGATEVDIVLTVATGLAFTFNSYLTGVTSIDWGDGTTNSALTHTYADYGKYTIKIYGMTAITDGTTSNGMCSGTIRHSVTNVFLGIEVNSVGAYAFAGFRSMVSIVIPKNVTSIGNYMVNACSLLKSIVFSNGSANIGNYVCYSCYALKSAVIPYGVASIKDYMFNSCYSLTRIAIPNGATSIATQGFGGCYSLTRIAIPNGVANIKGYAFASCYCLVEYDFSDADSVPDLWYTNVLSGINGLCKIFVPAALYSSWKSATNWAEFADYIVAV